MSGHRSLNDLAVTAFVRVHDRIYQGKPRLDRTRIPCAPNSLLLHTVGAKTALPRTSSLSHARDGSDKDADYLVVASNGGDPAHPVGTTT